MRTITALLTAGIISLPFARDPERPLDVPTSAPDRSARAAQQDPPPVQDPPADDLRRLRRSQDRARNRVAELEVQMARYREATDKLIATLNQANSELNARVKSLSQAQAELTVTVAELQVKLAASAHEAERRSRGRSRRGAGPLELPGNPAPELSRAGLVYRGGFQRSVESLEEAVRAMKRADSVEEGLKLVQAAQLDLDTARKALETRRR